MVAAAFRIVALLFIMVMMVLMVMVMFVLMLMVMMVLVFMFMLVLMVMIVMMLLMLLFKEFHSLFQSILVLHGLKYLLSIKLIPLCGDDRSMIIMRTKEFDYRLKLALVHT